MALENKSARRKALERAIKAIGGGALLGLGISRAKKARKPKKKEKGALKAKLKRLRELLSRKDKEALKKTIEFGR